jgi:hypothetical protein
MIAHDKFISTRPKVFLARITRGQGMKKALPTRE